jgi:hypothetical protein
MPGRTRRRVFASLIAVAATLGVWSASAGAATVTVGDPMTLPLDGGFVGNNGATITAANTTIQEPGAHVTSPVNGTIVQWRALPTGTGEYALRVLRPDGAGGYTGAGRARENISTPGDYTFGANLPIQAGDLIGLDMPNQGGVQGSGASVPQGVVSFWVPALPEGSTLAPFDTFTFAEFAFNATVQYPDTPTGTAPSKKCKKKRKHKRSAESAKKKKCKKKKKR